MKSKKTLVTTSLQNTWGKDNHIVFLGEWCKEYLERHKWSDRSFTTVSWHWRDRDKLINDYGYLKDLYENILSELAPKLNSIHGVNYSLRYWRIILGPWLYVYISAVWDRWENIKKVASIDIELETIVPDKAICRHVANDYGYAMGYIKTCDEWNYLIYCDILQAQAPSNITLINKKVILKKINTITISSVSLRRSIVNTFDFIVRKIQFTDSYNFILYKSNFPLTDLIRVYLNLKQMFRLHVEFDKKIQHGRVSHSMRSKIKITSSGTCFEDFLFQSIPKDIPKCYIEGYSDLSSHCALLPDAKIIMTAIAHFSNDLFKVWAAKQVNRGSKLIVSEHGGAIPPEIPNFFEHEENISDKRITWHIPLERSHVRLPPTKLKKIHINFSRKKILLVSLDASRHSGRCFSGISGPLIFDEFKQKCDFIDRLDEKSIKNFKIRAYQKQIWGTRLWYSERYGEEIIAATKTLHKDYSQSKLIICSYPQTTFSEAMFSEVPTILLYVDKFWETLPDFDSLILELKKSGIIYTDPVKAANHVNNICRNPMEWWNKKETIRARNMFFDMCVETSRDPISEWSSFFKNTLK
jgi:putative transferase (TIGR04331 family)